MSLEPLDIMTGGRTVPGPAAPDRPPGAGRPELPALTGLRGVAALLVVLGHLHVSGLRWLNLLDLQNVSVDLFFALSAFTLLYVYEPAPGTRFRFGPFLAARIARVVPMHTAALLVAALLVGHESGWFAPRPGIAWWPDALRQLLLVNGWPGIGSLKQWDLPAWSISVEALCYAVFPAWLLLDRALARASPNVLSVLTVVALTASVCVSVFWFDPAAYQWNAAVPPGAEATATGTIKAVLGFAAGVAAYRCWAQDNIVAAASSRLCDAAAVTLVIICVLAAEGLLNRQFAVLLSPVLILGAAGTGSVTARLLASRPVHFLGLISYALYLVHFPIKDAFAFFAPAVDPSTVPGYLVILGCALLAASACHALIEKPGRFWLRRLLAAPGRPRVS